MATKDPRVDAYIKNAQPFARPILTRLRKVVHAGCPGVVEGWKWSFPHFDYKGIFCSMAAFKEHLKTPPYLLAAAGKSRNWKYER